MSWIFALLLTVYGLIRAVLWVRGQIRYQLLKDRLPTRGAPRPAPDHLCPLLTDYFVATDALRVRAADDLRQISIVMVTDPDAPIGQVRNSRFRWAILDAWMRIREWRAAVERPIDDASGRALAGARYADYDLSEAPIDRCTQSIRSVWWQAVRARHFDPFVMDDVLAVRDALALLVAELEQQQQRLADTGTHPYRGTPAP